MEDGILMDAREEQSTKHPSPKLVTEDGISMDVREEQYAKQDLSPFRELQLIAQLKPSMLTL